MSAVGYSFSVCSRDSAVGAGLILDSFKSGSLIRTSSCGRHEKLSLQSSFVFLVKVQFVSFLLSSHQYQQRRRKENTVHFLLCPPLSSPLLLPLSSHIVLSSYTYNHPHIFYISDSSSNSTLTLELLGITSSTLLIPSKSSNMPIDKRKAAHATSQPAWFLSMYFSTHTLYLFLILISIAWNAYNAHQYQILADRQSQLENIVTELLPSSSALPSVRHQPPSLEQWLKKMYQSVRQFVSKEPSTDHSTTRTLRVSSER